MTINGKITHVLPERSGVSQRSGSEWRCGSYVIETLEQYPKKCNFEVFGTDRIQQFNIQVGQLLSVDFDIDAHEYNGRWFNSLRAWRVSPYDPSAAQTPNASGEFTPAAQPAQPAQAAASAAPAPAPQQPAAPSEDVFSESTDDLPF
ncbi:MAG: DUF3127 domain-containing protein [Bacteroidaceae bacterium]|nr:DUF3127 domain-containing protein [Bacteroidaceae bacterium]